MELPPRTRRIQREFRHVHDLFGTTSAYAENTYLPDSTVLIDRNYLRVRGEYCSKLVMPVSASELPPRTRRILAMETMCTDNPGTTSAYAENTVQNW